MAQNIAHWIEQLSLTPHPEGGYYREIITGDSLGSTRAPYSSIYFLLSHDNISHFHRIDADEIWYHHEGHTLLVHMIDPDGQYKCIRLGKNTDEGDVLQYVVPKGTIFASSIANEEGYALVGCMCQPAFDFNHFEMFTQVELKQLYPHLNDVIERYALAEK
jgi:predicted cupin superfamily sugar epimerase